MGGTFFTPVCAFFSCILILKKYILKIIIFFILTYFIRCLHWWTFTWDILEISFIITFIIIKFFSSIYCIWGTIGIITFIYFWYRNRWGICFFLSVDFITSWLFLLFCWRGSLFKLLIINLLLLFFSYILF
jgi:hypothetical protein